MEYSPGGMGGPGIPPSLYAYAAFTTASCEKVASSAAYLTGPVRTLYEGAAAACMAAFREHSEQWAQAESKYSQVEASTTAFECIDRDVYTMLGSLIDIHRQYPDYRIVRGTSGTTRTSCPRITEIVPDHGPIQGGQQVQVRGVNLPTRLVVDFDNVTASPVHSNGVEGTLTTPPLTEVDPENCPCKAYVYVQDFWWAGGVPYTYDPLAATSAPSQAP